MITKAEILALAKHYNLQPTTVHKDYVIGWLLRAVSRHDVLSQWVFKGGTFTKQETSISYVVTNDI